MATINTTAVLVALAATCLYLLYRSALPRPLPGIPYNHASAKSIAGDMLDARRARNAGDLSGWFSHLTQNHPIAQFFHRPWHRPFIVVNDYWAAHEVAHRRGRDFDRGDRTAEVFSCLVPENRLCMLSSDPRLRRNRALTRDLMTQPFLEQVSAPKMHEIAGELVRLWRVKARTAGDRPFSLQEDVHVAAMDMILASAFGLDRDRRMVREMLALAMRDEVTSRKMAALHRPADAHEFPLYRMPDEFESFKTIIDSISIVMSSPWPALHYGLLRKTWYRRVYSVAYGFLKTEIAKAVARLEALGAAAGSDDDVTAGDYSQLRCAMDNLVMREMRVARKEGRAPDYGSNHMRDELIGYLIGGHDTTSRTLAWSFKYLADNQAPQERLRRQLRAAFPSAAAEGRDPTVQEILSARAPYVDACVEEILRCSSVLPMVQRQSLVDTEILGYPIPKGTTVLCFTAGPSFRAPAVREVLPRGEKGEQFVPPWDPETVARFMPERWLKPRTDGEKKHDEDGDGEFDRVEYDSHAGPFLTFGGGSRGCWGQRLAYLELRITLVVLVWNFEFLPAKPELSSYRTSFGLTLPPEQCYVRLRPSLAAHVAS